MGTRGARAACCDGGIVVVAVGAVNEAADFVQRDVRAQAGDLAVVRRIVRFDRMVRHEPRGTTVDLVADVVDGVEPDVVVTAGA